MPSLSKKQVFLAALTTAFLLVLIAFLTVPAPVPHALQFGILGQTNNPSGAPMAIVGVTNHTGQARWFYFVAVVPTTNGWDDAKGWVQRQQPFWHRLAAHTECRVLLPAPEGAARWKFRCGSEREVSEPEGLWYLFVRRTGLSRFRLRDQPPRSMVMTTELGL
jgi:hypothetical protein